MRKQTSTCASQTGLKSLISSSNIKINQPPLHKQIPSEQCILSACAAWNTDGQCRCCCERKRAPVKHVRDKRFDLRVLYDGIMPFLDWVKKGSPPLLFIYVVSHKLQDLKQAADDEMNFFLLESNFPLIFLKILSCFKLPDPTSLFLFSLFTLVPFHQEQTAVPQFILRSLGAKRHLKHTLTFSTSFFSSVRDTQTFMFSEASSSFFCPVSRNDEIRDAALPCDWIVF